MSTNFRVINPATEQEIASVAAHDLDETNRAIERASSAAPAWAKVTPVDRARLLRRFADVVDAHVEELAQLEVANAGHTISNARWEAGNVRDVLMYYSGAPERHSGRQIPVAGGVDVTFYEPLGVVGIIVPWNFPMPIAGWGLAPALAAGNTVVLKPATLTPLTALRLGELALEAGISEGVFQVVTGDRRQHRGPQTRDAHASYRATTRRTGTRGRHFRRRVSSRHRGWRHGRQSIRHASGDP